MAVFMLNVCKFNGCGLTFKNLGHLIQHIEETHIDYDPQVVEQTELQQPTCIPLSYALRFLTDAARKESSKPIIPGRLSQTNAFPVSSRNRNNAATTPTGSEAEEGDEFVSEPEDSNDSWTTSEEFSADFILRYGSRVISPNIASAAINQNSNSNNNSTINNNNNNDSSNSNNSNSSNSSDKPFACPVPGCKKRYKNVNGIKYHSKNGHKKDGKIRKAFRCPCGKSYKTPYGLKNHAAIQHAGTVLQIKLLQNEKSSSTRSENVHHHRDNCPKNIAANSLKIAKQALMKAKVAAIEDHGYIKSEKPIFTDSEVSNGRHCDDDELGILTPASTPPLSLQSPAKNDTSGNQPENQERSLHKYLANVVTANNNGQHRRNAVDNNNAY